MIKTKYKTENREYVLQKKYNLELMLLVLIFSSNCKSALIGPCLTLSGPWFIQRIIIYFYLIIFLFKWIRNFEEMKISKLH